MHKFFRVLILSFFALFFASASVFAESSAPLKIVELKIDGQIEQTQLYVLRRAFRDAASNKADAVIININTPGGRLDITLEMMNIISDFKGKTICYVNSDAISAGSYIASACNEIWFSPKGVMGAAEAINADGSDIDGAAARKLKSFMESKLKAMLGDTNPNRLKVQLAMADPEMVLQFGDKVLKEKGKLLSLTANEAVQVFDGHPLLANGIAKDINELLQKSYGEGASFDIQVFKMSALETFARFSNLISPALMGLGILLLILDLKFGGFGVMGAIGVGILLFVFFGSHIAGLTGFEAIILFVLGVILLCVEIFVLPGFIIFAVLGIAMILFSLVLTGVPAMPSDSWLPSMDSLSVALAKLGIAVFAAIFLAVFLGKYMKRTPLWRTFVLDGGLARGSQGELGSPDTLVGQKGITLSTMVPNGKVLIDGKTYDAVSEDSAYIEKNVEVEVIALDSFQLKIKKIS